MTRRVKVREVRRRQIDEDKLALAFLLLAKSLDGDEESPADEAITGETDARGGRSEREAS